MLWAFTLINCVMRINSKIVILVAALPMLSISVWGQKKDAPQFTKAEIDSTSYLVGVNFGSFIKSNGFTQIEIGSVPAKAVLDHNSE